MGLWTTAKKSEYDEFVLKLTNFVAQQFKTTGQSPVLAEYTPTEGEHTMLRERFAMPQKDGFCRYELPDYFVCAHGRINFKYST
jgi:hypothetical protein